MHGRSSPHAVQSWRDSHGAGGGLASVLDLSVSGVEPRCSWDGSTILALDTCSMPKAGEGFDAVATRWMRCIITSDGWMMRGCGDTGCSGPARRPWLHDRRVGYR